MLCVVILDGWCKLLSVLCLICLCLVYGCIVWVIVYGCVWMDVLCFLVGLMIR